MSAAANHEQTTEKPSVLMRVIYALPIIGMFARLIGKDVNNFFWILPILLLALVGAVYMWGLAALTMTALGGVVFMYTFFVLVTWPFQKD